MLNTPAMSFRGCNVGGREETFARKQRFYKAESGDVEKTWPVLLSSVHLRLDHLNLRLIRDNKCSLMCKDSDLKN